MARDFEDHCWKDVIDADTIQIYQAYRRKIYVGDNPAVLAHLQQKRIDSLIICGESTSGCVRASTVDAYSYGFHNVVVEECTYDRSLITHKVNLFDLHHKYADVMHIEDVLAHLDGLARG